MQCWEWSQVVWAPLKQTFECSLQPDRAYKLSNGLSSIQTQTQNHCYILCPAERSTDGAGSAPSCSHAVHPGDGIELPAGSSRLLPTVLPQSQSKTHIWLIPHVHTTEWESTVYAHIVHLDVPCLSEMCQTDVSFSAMLCFFLILLSLLLRRTDKTST